MSTASGTNPNAYQGCFCEDQTQVLDPATINCITPVGPTAKAKRNRKREEKKKHLLLQSLKNVQDWSVFSHDVLCPSGQQACPILPSLASFECIDVSFCFLLLVISIILVCRPDSPRHFSRRRLRSIAVVDACPFKKVLTVSRFLESALLPV